MQRLANTKIRWILIRVNPGKKANVARWTLCGRTCVECYSSEAPKLAGLRRANEYVTRIVILRYIEQAGSCFATICLDGSTNSTVIKLQQVSKISTIFI